jgi:hypothetical protein
LAVEQGRVSVVDLAWALAQVPVLVVGLVLALAPVQAQPWGRHSQRQTPAILLAGQGSFSW